MKVTLSRQEYEGLKKSIEALNSREAIEILDKIFSPKNHIPEIELTVSPDKKSVSVDIPEKVSTSFLRVFGAHTNNIGSLMSKGLQPSITLLLSWKNELVTFGHDLVHVFR